MHATYRSTNRTSNAEGNLTCQLTLILSTAGTEYVGIAMYSDGPEIGLRCEGSTESGVYYKLM